MIALGLVILVMALCAAISAATAARSVLGRFACPYQSRPARAVFRFLQIEDTAKNRSIQRMFFAAAVVIFPLVLALVMV